MTALSFLLYLASAVCLLAAVPTRMRPWNVQLIAAGMFFFVLVHLINTGRALW